MGRYQVHRSDANAKRITAALKLAGVHVELVGRPMDALIYSPLTWSIFCARLAACGVVAQMEHAPSGVASALRGPVGQILAEFKTPHGKTRSKAQADFMKRWPAPWLLLRTKE